MLSNFFKFNFKLNKRLPLFFNLINPSTYSNFIISKNIHNIPFNRLINRINLSNGKFIFVCTYLYNGCYNNSWLTFKRFYRPQLHIDWVGIKSRWRAKQVLQKKKKHKNHPRVAMRFKLTRFGWERLQSGRNSRKMNLTRLKYRNKMRVKYVSRSDLKKLDRQMPGYRLRIRDPPINNNPNIRKARTAINHYFG